MQRTFYQETNKERFVEKYAKKLLGGESKNEGRSFRKQDCAFLMFYRGKEDRIVLAEIRPKASFCKIDRQLRQKRGVARKGDVREPSSGNTTRAPSLASESGRVRENTNLSYDDTSWLKHVDWHISNTLEPTSRLTMTEKNLNALGTSN